MKRYRCLSDEYNSFEKGEIYNLSDISYQVRLYPDDWELVEDDESISLVDMMRDVLEKVKDVSGYEEVAIRFIDDVWTVVGVISCYSGEESIFICDLEYVEEYLNKNKL